VGEPFRVVKGDGSRERGLVLASKRATLGLTHQQAADAIGIEWTSMLGLEQGSAIFVDAADYARAHDVLERAVGGSL